MKNDWDWRRKSRSEAGLRAMKWICRALNAAGFIGFLTSRWFWAQELWGAACMAVTAVSLALYIAFPQYLTLVGGKALREMGYAEKVYDVQLGAMGCLSLTLAVLSNFREISLLPYLALSLALGAAVCLVVWRRSSCPSMPIPCRRRT